MLPSLFLLLKGVLLPIFISYSFMIIQTTIQKSWDMVAPLLVKSSSF